MKNKVILLATALLFSSGAFAQKDEMKTLKKLYEKEMPTAKDIAEFKATLIKAEPLIANSTEADKVYFNYYKAYTPMMEMTEMMSKPENQANPQNALKFFTPKTISSMGTVFNEVLEYEKKSGKQVFTKDIMEDFASSKPMLLNYAIGLGNQNRPKDASDVLYAIYLIDKKDSDNLYYAASYAVNAKDYDAAYKYYDELKKINYSGESTVYTAKNLASGQDDTFATKEQRDQYIKLKTHSNPKEEKIPSKRGEIYKNLALILVQNGKTEEAKTALQDARKANPDDISLVIEEANLYLKLNDEQTYKRLISEAIQKSPNNPDLVFNLGVIASKTNAAEAEAYYKKAIEIKPDYVQAYLNLAVLKLVPEDKLVAEMNKLGTSEKDNKRYAELKKQRQEMFLGVIPYLEKAHELDPKDEAVATTLSNVYGVLEMTAKRKALKEEMAKK